MAKRRKPDAVDETLPMAASQRGLALALERPLSTVRHWMTHDTWPFGRRGPWNVEGVRAWAELAFGPAGGDAVEPATDLSTLKRRADIRVAVERGANLKLTREEREGKLHDAALCLDRRLGQLHRFRSELLKLPRVIRRRLAGQGEAVIERRLEEALRQILDGLASEIAGEVRGPAQPRAVEPPPARPAKSAKPTRGRPGKEPKA